mmetsp:Transcript_7648/g.9436  ORF Transcript_7648/g.9436 Transcript_7648/m.9436 type:complete len:232 (+) Transcript_7648:387-1082(+)
MISNIKCRVVHPPIFEIDQLHVNITVLNILLHHNIRRQQIVMTKRNPRILRNHTILQILQLTTHIQIYPNQTLRNTTITLTLKLPPRHKPLRLLQPRKQLRPQPRLAMPFKILVQKLRPFRNPHRYPPPRQLLHLQRPVPEQPPLHAPVLKPTAILATHARVTQRGVRVGFVVAVDHALGAEDAEEDGGWVWGGEVGDAEEGVGDSSLDGSDFEGLCVVFGRRGGGGVVDD